jgi:farnesyl-diphosphate farnesyltransferase
MDRVSRDLLKGLLKPVSRSFYLTLGILPGAVRSQIGLAYLLARASDTIADTDAIPVEDRLRILRQYQDRVLTEKGGRLELGQLAGQQSSPAERLLLQRVEDAIALLPRFERADQERIREVLKTIISGQMLDVERFATADPARLAALETDEDLEHYIYRVAGCVGEFWTRMTRAHLFPNTPLDEPRLLANGVRFGKGLQLVNVLRDIPADLRIGRCYLPRRRLAEIGLAPEDLRKPSNEAGLRRLYDEYVDRAEQYLGAGWTYTNDLPFRCVRVRLACAWPILIGVNTLAKLRRPGILDPNRRIKISRTEVRKLIVQSVIWYPIPRRWRGLVQNTLPHGGTLAK